ncbi:ABC-2 type transport system permease protein [Paenibacillus sp. yr247]|uniref:ABC transporter permease n=1 Tax=Paenibacillus sp. yr247 TaxID=1761880 RepID=UPI0008805401|nr:ABC transporter permease [Paenibacillus sp. yr247]SDM77640.1 ABC-2 type transport system permease protein [Paenibacillus sp. yr247]
MKTTAAEPATMERLTGPGKWLTELNVLIRIQFAIVRDSWAWIVVMATMFPLTTVLFMKFFTENPSEETLIRLIAGNLIFGIIVMGMNGMGQDISWQKHAGHFTFYASLPISKINFVLANLARGMMNTIPSFLILGAIGQWVYGIQFQYSWGMLPVIVLSIFSCVGIGVAIGFWSPNHQLTNMLVQALMMVVTFLSPVLVEMSRLPIPLQWFSYLLPSTYAADAMSIVFLQGWTKDVLADCIVLVGYGLATFAMINKLVKWRMND